MNSSEPPRSARDALREQLLLAARRDDARNAAALPARRRRSRRTLSVLVALLFGAAAAAGAADLISTGDPVPDTSSSGVEYRPGKPGAPVLAARAKDPAGGQGWGVGIYESTTGESCAIAGQVRGYSLGEMRGNLFHQYEPGSTGTCGDLKRLGLLWDIKHVNGLSILFGRTRDANRYVIANQDGETLTAKPGPGGAFLWVLKGTLSYADVLTRTGAVIKR